MSIVKEFKEFAIKGNVVDLAVGVIIGAAFGKVVTSVVADIVMPPLGLAIGGVSFAQLKLILREAGPGAPAVTLNYGQFLQHVLDFVIVAAAVFVLIKGINRLKRAPIPEPPKPAVPLPPSAEVLLLTEIRDALVARK